jgi:hypothetical protein
VQSRFRDAFSAKADSEQVINDVGSSVTRQHTGVMTEFPFGPRAELPLADVQLLEGAR